MTTPSVSSPSIVLSIRDDDISIPPNSSSLSSSSSSSSSTSPVNSSSSSSSSTVVITFPDGQIAAGISENEPEPKPDENEIVLSSSTFSPSSARFPSLSLALSSSSSSSPLLYEDVVREVRLSSGLPNGHGDDLSPSTTSRSSHPSSSSRSRRLSYDDEDDTFIPSSTHLRTIRSRTKSIVHRIGFFMTMDVLYFIVLYILFATLFNKPVPTFKENYYDSSFTNPNANTTTIYDDDDNYSTTFTYELPRYHLNIVTIIIFTIEIIIYIIGLLALHYRSVNGLGTYIMLQLCAIFPIIRSAFVYYDIIFIIIRLSAILSTIYFRIVIVNLYHRLMYVTPYSRNPGTHRTSPTHHRSSSRLREQIEENNALARDVEQLRQILASPSAVRLLQQHQHRLTGRVVIEGRLIDPRMILSNPSITNNSTRYPADTIHSNTSPTTHNNGEDDYDEAMVRAWQQDALRRVQFHTKKNEKNYSTDTITTTNKDTSKP